MVNSNTGVNFNLFSNVIDKYGDSVTYKPVSKTTSNISGDETLTLGTSSTFNAFIVRKNRPWFVDEAGLIEGGDALMLVKPSQAVYKDDLIEWNSNTYRIKDVLNRDMIGGNVAYKVCNLFKI